MANVCEAHSCLPEQSPETKLQIMPIENEIADAGVDDDAIEVQQLHVFLRSDVDRADWRSNTMLGLDIPSIELDVVRA